MSELYLGLRTVTTGKGVEREELSCCSAFMNRILVVSVGLQNTSEVKRGGEGVAEGGRPRRTGRERRVGEGSEGKAV